VGQIVKNCEDLTRCCTPFDISKVTASLLLKMSLRYYKDVRVHAQRSFNWALRIAVLGTIFFLAAIVFAWTNRTETGWITVIAGALIQVISGVNFYLYRKASDQFASFHVCLERTQRYTLANLVCENLKDNQDTARAELIRVMANAPMLTLGRKNEQI
jgi:hypothetical protein